MRPAAAVTAAESVNGRESFHIRERSGPLVLEMPAIVGVPHADGTYEVAHVIYVPVPALFNSKMSRHPRPNATRPECASDVDVIPGCQLNQTALADLGFSLRRASKNQRISPGARLHRERQGDPGNWIVNVEPEPGVLFAVMSPPMRLHKRRLIVSPRPVPSNLLSACCT